jgi:hypothetical protein
MPTALINANSIIRTTPATTIGDQAEAIGSGAAPRTAGEMRRGVFSVAACVAKSAATGVITLRTLSLSMVVSRGWRWRTGKAKTSALVVERKFQKILRTIE